MGLCVGRRTWQLAAEFRRAPGFSAQAGRPAPVLHPEPAPCARPSPAAAAAFAGGGLERSLVDAVLGVTPRGGGASAVGAG